MHTYPFPLFVQRFLTGWFQQEDCHFSGENKPITKNAPKMETAVMTAPIPSEGQ